MSKEDKILNKFGRETGMQVPDGFFDSFRTSMLNSLPEYPKTPRPLPLSKWHRVRPYVYLAAMFVGIWCMMKAFHLASQTSADLDNPPANVVTAMNESDYFDLVAPIDDNSNSDDYVLMEEASENYDNMADFQKDFGYTLEPDYASMPVKA